MTDQSDVRGADSLTIATALSYAIVAIESLPPEWRSGGPKDELDSMRALLQRVLPDSGIPKPVSYHFGRGAEWTGPAPPPAPHRLRVGSEP